MKVNAPLYALNQGEVSTLALTRVDVAKMRLAATCQLNWQPWVIGPMMLRPGLQFVGEVLGDAVTRLVTFIFSRLDTALLELTPNSLRIWVNEQLVTRVAVGTLVVNGHFEGAGSWVTSDTTAGCTATVTPGVLTLICSAIGGLARAKQAIAVAPADYGKEHGIRFVVLNGPVTVRAGSSDGLSDLIAQSVLDTGTHSLTCTPSSTINLQIDSSDTWNKRLSSVTIDNPPSGAPTPLVLPTPWAQPDLISIRYDQSGDIIFSTCRGQQQSKIERRSTNGWSVVAFRATNGPFHSTASLVTDLTPGAYSGNTTLTSVRPYFEQGHVGALFRLFSSGQFYQTVLGKANAFSPAVRVVGVGATARNYSWSLSGTWVGTLTFQRSFDGPDSGFADVASTGAPGAIASATGTSGGTPPLDNLIVWERVGFKGGDYTSGSAAVISSYAGGGGFAIVRVIGWNSPTSVNIEILQPFASLNATTDWVEGQWSAASNGDFPTSVAFHEGRLGQFGQDNCWLSESDNYTGYSNEDANGDPLGDAGAIIRRLGSGDVDTISWAVSSLRLLMGRERSIACARSSSFDEPMTPVAFSVKDCSTQGAARMPALKVDQSVVMLQQSGRRVYKLAFDAQKMDYVAHDVTRLNPDIGKVGFVDNAVSRQPDTQEIWIRGDGQVALMLDDVDDDVVAWWRMQTLGVFENAAVLPGAGIEDLEYYVVRRIINGVTRRFIERKALRDTCVGGSINQLADSHLVYSGAPASSITLPHLPNTAVVLWGDGRSLGTVTTDGSGVATLPNGATASNIVGGLGGVVISYPPDPTVPQAATNTLTVGAQYNGYPAEVYADQNSSGRLKRVGPIVVAGGLITLPNNRQSTRIVAFLGFVAPFESAKLAYGAQGGSALTKKKKIDHVGLVLYNAHATGLQTGQSFDNLDPMPSQEDGQAVDANLIWGEYDEPGVPVKGTWDTDARLCLLAQAPLPCTVGGVVIGMQTNE